MILVSVGGDVHNFSRLIQKILELIKEHKIQEKVIIQSGNTKIKIKLCENFDFIDWYKFEKLIEKSRMIISHAGAGTIISALKFGKPVIVVPRMKKYGEHINDHQIQITKELSLQKRIIPVYDIKDLEKSIELANKFKPALHSGNRKDILRTIEKFCIGNNI